MKIDYSILSTNDNPTYKDFWEVVKPVWVGHIKIKPILVLITNEDSINDYGDHIIFKIKEIDGIDTGFQSQISRMWVTKFFPKEVCLTSDIDMLPINENYFKKSIENISEDKLVIYSSDAYPPQTERYPICYNAAKGKTFSKILMLDKFKNFEDYCRHLLDRNQGWDTDELYFGERVNRFPNQKIIIKLNRGWSNGNALFRIDRSFWFYNPNDAKDYIDSHMLRPYKTYKNEIDELIKSII